MVDYEIHTLPNGIRLVHKQVSNTKIVHCGFILDIGSRDEGPAEQGIAHFWEHMAFKGTRKRKAFHILNRLDSVGGELNAYTSKEKICFYASALDQFFENAFELLTDITFDSVFPQTQLELERKVILEEMAMYLDTPEDAIQDEFDNVVFPNHPLGRNILGTNESVRAFSRDDFKRFIYKNLNTERLIFSSVGNVPFKKVLRFANKYLKDIPVQIAERQRMSYSGYEPLKKEMTRNTLQSLCAMGRPAYELKSKYRIPFFMLVNILGGPGMNSRLNLALREKYGFVYSVDASYSAFTDTGLFGIYFGTEHKQLARCVRLVNKELQKLRQTPLGSLQLHRAKEQIMGQLAMAEENNVSLMLMMGKSMLDLNRIDPLEAIFNRIRKVRSSELRDISNDIFQEESLSLLKFTPHE